MPTFRKSLALVLEVYGSNPYPLTFTLFNYTFNMDKIKQFIHYFLDLDTLFYKLGTIALMIMMFRYILRRDTEYLLFTMGLLLIFIDLGW